MAGNQQMSEPLLDGIFHFTRANRALPNAQYGVALVMAQTCLPPAIYGNLVAFGTGVEIREYMNRILREIFDHVDRFALINQVPGLPTYNNLIQEAQIISNQLVGEIGNAMITMAQQGHHLDPGIMDQITQNMFDWSNRLMAMVVARQNIFLPTIRRCSEAIATISNCCFLQPVLYRGGNAFQTVNLVTDYLNRCAQMTDEVEMQLEYILGYNDLVMCILYPIPGVGPLFADLGEEEGGDEDPSNPFNVYPLQEENGK